MLHRPRNSGRECAWWTNSLMGQFLHQLSLVQSSRSIQRMQTVPWPKHFFSIFREDQALLHRPRNSGRECAWWTNPLLGQFLHQLSPVQSSRSIQHMQTVSWPKHFFQFLGRTSLCFSRPRNLGRECAWWTNSLLGQFLHQLSPVQSSRSIQTMQTVPWQKHFVFQFLGRTSHCFTDQETQEENVLGGPTPFWISSYTSYLRYKVQDRFSPCRQSHGQNVFFKLVLDALIEINR